MIILIAREAGLTSIFHQPSTKLNLLFPSCRDLSPVFFSQEDFFLAAGRATPGPILTDNSGVENPIKSIRNDNLHVVEIYIGVVPPI
jgi:hypothetical protein